MSNIYIQEPPTHGKVLLSTSVGDIDIELWSKEAPKACRNFIQLLMEGYYDGTVFHRVVKEFIVQGGDPTGTGEGGESIYGEPFKDEIHSRLRFNHRGLVAMANAGPNDNGSQFFFTMGPAGELNKKHTIFGKVTGNTLFNMLKLEDVETDENERPPYPHKLIKGEILSNPFDDIIPRQLRSKRKDSGDDAKKTKSKSKATKNFNLLSFGEEAEEDEEETIKASQIMRGKSKSSHDLIDDPRLSSVPAVEVEEPKQDKKRKSIGDTEESDTGSDIRESVRKKLKKEDGDDNKRDDSRRDEGKRDDRREDSKPDISRRDESRRDESRKEDRRDDSKREDRRDDRRDESRREDRRDESKTDISRREDRRDESKPDISRREDRRDESKTDISRREDRRDESKTDISRREDRRDESKTDISRREDRRDERRDDKRDDSKRDDRRREDRKSEGRRKDDSDHSDEKREERRRDEKKKDDGEREEKRKEDRKEDRKREDSDREGWKREDGRRDDREKEEKRNKDRKDGTAKEDSKREDSRKEDFNRSTDKKSKSVEMRKESSKLPNESADSKHKNDRKTEESRDEKTAKEPKKEAESERKEEVKKKGKVETVVMAKVDMLEEYKQERQKYKELRQRQGKKGSSREADTLAMLAKFQNKLQSVRSVSESDEEKMEEKMEEEEEDESGESWMTHKLKFEDKTRKVLDANITDADRYEIYDPRNPLTMRRREATKKTSGSRDRR